MRRNRLSALGPGDVSGGWSLIAYVVGFVVARTLIVRRVKGEGPFRLPGSEEQET